MGAGDSLAVVQRREVVRVDKTAQSLAIQRAMKGEADYFEHLGFEEVLALAAAAEARTGWGKRLPRVGEASEPTAEKMVTSGGEAVISGRFEQ